jgi:hypothetical protein
MSIVRVGLAETKNFAEGYDAIFGKKKEQEEKKDEPAGQSSDRTSDKQEEKIEH